MVDDIVKIQLTDMGRRLQSEHGVDATPQKQTVGAAGYDLCAAVTLPVILEPGQGALISCGFRMALPAGYEAQIRPRSGFAVKNSIIVPNSPGTIDSDYRGEVHVALLNLGDRTHEILPGQRIAQMVISRLDDVSLRAVGALDDTERGEGGFGSTGE